MEARRLSLPWIAGVSKPSVPRSTMKPRILPSWASDFAHTTAMSEIGLLVIHIFWPVSR
ncbi:hypothetical protein KBTX_04459 [wastewater metagenome]|uniref:Uncharacterized protein n=2 Tax=unclassified sequences TaxID=12908 RepID=A0A5B8RG94_9ZZZZ|nr:hypothetical protein KBTEX_04459 [uncultured organism]